MDFSIPDRTVYCITFPSDQSIRAQFGKSVTPDPNLHSHRSSFGLGTARVD